jgi:tetratricopeptide (TPR) repeat protein
LTQHSPIFFNARAGVHLRKRDYEQTIADYDQALRIDPEFVLARYNRGWSFSISGDLDRAIAEDDEVIRLDPGAYLAFMARGAAHYFNKAYWQAIEDYTQAIRLRPENHRRTGTALALIA